MFLKICIRELEFQVYFSWHIFRLIFQFCFNYMFVSFLKEYVKSISIYFSLFITLAYDYDSRDLHYTTLEIWWSCWPFLLYSRAVAIIYFQRISVKAHLPVQSK